MEDDKKQEKKDSVVKAVKKTVSEMVSSFERKTSDSNTGSGGGNGGKKKGKKHSSSTTSNISTISAKDEPIYDVPPVESGGYSVTTTTTTSKSSGTGGKTTTTKTVETTIGGGATPAGIETADIGSGATIISSGKVGTGVSYASAAAAGAASDIGSGAVISGKSVSSSGGIGSGVGASSGGAKIGSGASYSTSGVVEIGSGATYSSSGTTGGYNAAAGIGSGASAGAGSATYSNIGQGSGATARGASGGYSSTGIGSGASAGGSTTYSSGIVSASADGGSSYSTGKGSGAAARGSTTYSSGIVSGTAGGGSSYSTGIGSGAVAGGSSSYSTGIGSGAAAGGSSYSTGIGSGTAGSGIGHGTSYSTSKVVTSSSYVTGGSDIGSGGGYNTGRIGTGASYSTTGSDIGGGVGSGYSTRRDSEMTDNMKYSSSAYKRTYGGAEDIRSPTYGIGSGVSQTYSYSSSYSPTSPKTPDTYMTRDSPYVSRASHIIHDTTGRGAAATISKHMYTKSFDVKDAVSRTTKYPSKSGGIEYFMDAPMIERASWKSESDLGIWADFHPSVWSGRVLKMVTEMGSASIGGISPALSANAAKSFLEATDKEKKELQGLNDRLGNYIDRVKRLEEQNRKLVADLDELRGKWGKDTSEIKIKYSESLSTARKDIDDAARRKAEIDVKVARLRDDLAEYRSRYEDIQHRREGDREKINQWTNAIADAQAELEMLRARWKQLTEEEKRLNADNVRIWEELQKARNDLDEETIGRIDFQNQVQTLMEELEFLRRVHEQEVKELQALLAQAPADTREFFKNELALAIRDIKDEYDYIAKQGKQDMESWYKLKVSEVQGSANRAAVESNYQREEVKRMRDNISDLRGKLGDLENKNALLEKEVQNLNYQLQDDQRQYEAALNDRDATLRRMREECQTLVAELQALLDTKQMLDAEIAIYRKMLEGEESRVGLRQMVEQVVKTHSLQQQEDTDSTRSVRGEVSTKTTFQRSAKGNVTIAECDPNGKFITLENTHRTKDENLGEHKLKRKLDGNRREIVYSIPANTVLKAGKTMKIYARDQGGINNPPESLVFEGENTWGIGANVVTSLYNKEGEERATHTQKTIQTGQ